MLEVEPTAQRGRNSAIRSGRNGNQAVIDAVSEAFARWLAASLTGSRRTTIGEANHFAAQYREK